MGSVRIPLHSRKYSGLFALIDEEDCERIAPYRWHPRKSDKSRDTFYAYASIYESGISRHSIQMHRVLMDAPRGTEVDHINRNGLDNRRSVNLRFATSTQNHANIGLLSSNTSGYRGVGFHKKSQKWRATIKVGRKAIHLGLWLTARGCGARMGRESKGVMGRVRFY